MPTPTDEQLQEASARNIPPYNWIPPEAQTSPIHHLLEITDNLRDPYPFPKENLPNCASLASKAFEGFPGQEHSALGAPLVKKPHPLSDFSHIDPDATRPSISLQGPVHSAPDFTKLKGNSTLARTTNNSLIWTIWNERLPIWIEQSGR